MRKKVEEEGERKKLQYSKSRTYLYTVEKAEALTTSKREREKEQQLAAKVSFLAALPPALPAAATPHSLGVGVGGLTFVPKSPTTK